MTLAHRAGVRSRAGCKHLYLPPPALLPVGLDLIPSDGEGITNLELWRFARFVRDWLETPRALDPNLAVGEQRSFVELRRAAALTEAPDLQAVLAGSQVFLTEPLWIDPRNLANRCFSVAPWLEKNGRVDLAIRYAECAARIDQVSARKAALAARLNRIAGHFWRADVWYGRAVGLANESDDQVTKVRAYLGWGTLHADYGNTGRARKLFRRAASGAKRCGEKWLSAMVHHDLLVMTATIGEYREAELSARRAFHYYPAHNKRIPAFGYDVARFLIRVHAYGAAVRLLLSAVEKIGTPHEKAVVWGGLAWAAGGAKRRDLYSLARTHVRDLVSSETATAAGALINLAYGARAIGEWDDAEKTAHEVLALVVNTGRGVSEEEHLARSLLADVAKRVEAPPEAVLLSRIDDPDGKHIPISALVDRIRERVERWRGATWRRKRQAGPEDVPLV